jgi:exosortase sorting signal-containing protein
MIKNIKTLLYSLILVFALAGAASAQVLYGVAHLGNNGPSTFYIISQNDGAATPIGPVGFERCGSLAFDNTTQTFFATCERTDGSDTPVLVNINPATGAGTEVGVLDVCSNWTDLSFRNADNTLFATGFFNTCGSNQNTLVTVNTETGTGTIVGPMGNLGCCGSGMAFSQNDDLFFLDGDVGPPNTLYTVNQATGAANVIASVQYPAILDRGPRTNAMVFNPNNGGLFASVVNGGGESPPRENFLGLVNTFTGNVTIIGPTVEGLDGIAFGSELQFVPTLSEWGLIAMAGLLGIAGLLFVRRKKLTA